MVGLTVASPDQQGWRTIIARPNSVAFGSAGPATGETTIAGTMAFLVPGYDSNRAFLQHIADKRATNDDPTRFRVISMTNRQVTFKGTRCLKYTNVSQDMKSRTKGTSGPQFLKNVGYVCRHPEKRDLALQMEYSNRSGAKAISAATQQAANRFFAGIRLIDVNI